MKDYGFYVFGSLGFTVACLVFLAGLALYQYRKVAHLNNAKTSDTTLEQKNAN